ncbi:MAG: histidine--tRNA ligase [Verrucomicrobia bacterium]|jgi:histidyl-tRNA synthetase|nr:histidine--tRNA ligase [Verrucomicrobiota bacterium]
MATDVISFSPPRGMRDFYPEDMVLRNAVFDAWSAAARQSGFDEYDACVVESLALLKRKSGEEITDQIYHFKDKSGRELALRPEMTPTLARMIVAKQGSLTMPLKWFTIAQCFRYERTTRGRKREHYQLNLDVIGESSVSAEAEVIATAAGAMSRLGLTGKHYQIRFSSRALLSELLLKLGIEAAHHAATFLALDKRGKITDEAIKTLLENEGVSPEAIPTIFALLEVETLEQARDMLGAETPAYQDVLAFLETLDAYGIADLMSFDISVIRGLSYYTGIVFEAFDTSEGLRAIFGGGRYDNLLGDIGGAATTGVGLGFGDVVIAELLEALGLAPATGDHAPDIAIGFMQDAQQLTAVRIATALRASGKGAHLALHAEKPKAFFKRVGKGTAPQAIYLGPDDTENGTARIKTLADRTEETVSIEELLQA